MKVCVRILPELKILLRAFQIKKHLVEVNLRSDSLKHQYLVRGDDPLELRQVVGDESRRYSGGRTPGSGHRYDRSDTSHRS